MHKRASSPGIYLHMVQPSNNNNGSSDMDSLEDMLRKVNIVLVLLLPCL